MSDFIKVHGVYGDIITAGEKDLREILLRECDIDTVIEKKDYLLKSQIKFKDKNLNTLNVSENIDELYKLINN